MPAVEYLGSNKPVNNASPLVSVCVQTYQHAAFIAQCLNGILAQESSFPIEVLVGEDQSTDGTRDICIAYADKHPDRIRLFLNDRSEIITIDGRATGRVNMLNLLGQARGEFVALCEGDDYWTDATKLERQVAAMREHPECSMAFHNAMIVGEGEPRIFSRGLVEGHISIEPIILEVGFIPPQSMFFRRSLLGLSPWTRHVFGFDLAIHLTMAAQGPLYYMDRIMSAYRVHPGGISRNPPMFYLEVKHMELLCLFNAASEYKYDDLIKQRLEKFRKWMAKHVPRKAPPLPERIRAWSRRKLAALLR